MKKSEITDLDEFSQRMENHRAYVNRQWQYFAAYLIFNGFILNVVKELYDKSQELSSLLVLSSIIISGVSFHLIHWTKMRIYRNAVHINNLSQRVIFELPRKTRGISFMLELAVLSLAGCWLYWTYTSGWIYTLIGSFFFLVIMIHSILSTKASQ